MRVGGFGEAAVSGGSRAKDRGADDYDTFIIILDCPRMNNIRLIFYTEGLTPFVWISWLSRLELIITNRYTETPAPDWGGEGR